MSFFDRLPGDELCGFAILERSSRDASYAYATYEYPSAAASPLTRVLLARAAFGEPSYSRACGVWHYSAPLPGALPSAALPHTRAAAVVVLSRVHCAPKFLALAAALAAVYAASGSPPRVLEAWLAAFLKASVPAALLPAGAAAWAGRSYDIARGAEEPAGLHALLTRLGVESILIWTALLLRRRVAVYGSSRAAVAAAVALLPQLTAHRIAVTRDASGATRAGSSDAIVAVDLGVPLYPLVVLRAPWRWAANAADAGGDGAAARAAEEEAEEALHAHTRAEADEGVALQLAELAGGGGGGAGAGAPEDDAAATAAPSSAARQTYYIAGFTDPAVATARGLWDVCVDLDGRSVAVADAAAAELAMSPVHKGVAKALLAALEAPDASDASVAAALAARTAALLAQLRELYPSGVPAAPDAPAALAAAERLRAAGVPEASQRFLRAAALAELGPQAEEAEPAAAAAAAATATEQPAVAAEAAPQ